MIAPHPVATLFVTAPPLGSQEQSPGRTATALAIVAAVLVVAVITETIRYRRRRRVFRPVPLPRRAVAPVVIKERSTRDLAPRAELVAHRQ